jgi:hypothetical protein
MYFKPNLILLQKNETLCKIWQAAYIIRLVLTVFLVILALFTKHFDVAVIHLLHALVMMYCAHTVTRFINDLKENRSIAYGVLVTKQSVLVDYKA